MNTPLNVKLLGMRYKLLDALLTPILFVFRRICDQQERIQNQLNKRGWGRLPSDRGARRKAVTK
jgi:hypothetical protein